MRQQSLDTAVSEGAFLMGSVARFLLSVVGTVLLGVLPVKYKNCGP